MPVKPYAVRRTLTTKEGDRTTVQMECRVWETYDVICDMLEIKRNALSKRIDEQRSADLPLTSALRIWIVAYLRASLSRHPDPAGAADQAVANPTRANGVRD